MKEKNIARKLKKLDDSVTKVMTENFEMSKKITALEEKSKQQDAEIKALEEKCQKNQ